MSLLKRKLKDGELSSCEQINELIRRRLEYNEDDFYGMCGRGHELKLAFLTGLWIGSLPIEDARRNMMIDSN